MSEMGEDTRRSPSLPWIQEGFGGPGISFVEGLLYLLYKA